MFVTGPDVLKTVTNEQVTAEELGGRPRTTRKSLLSRMALFEKLTSKRWPKSVVWSISLPANNREKPPVAVLWMNLTGSRRSAGYIGTRATPNTPYDMKELIHKHG